MLGLGNAAGGIVDALGRALDGLFTSDAEREQARAVLEKLRQQPGALQVELTKIEAAHRSVFVAGWRPFIGWVCGSGLAWNFIGHPMAVWALAVFAPQLAPPPALDLGPLISILLAMLGMSGLRTYEKHKGLTG